MKFALPALVSISLMLALSPLARAAELVMVEQAGCHWCARWDAEVSHIYPKTDEGQMAPLRRVDLRDLPEEISFVSQPVFTPTFVLVQDDQELGRLEGYNGDEFFWFLLGQLIKDHADRMKLH